jgi:hypothetical protein
MLASPFAADAGKSYSSGGGRSYSSSSSRNSGFSSSRSSSSSSSRSSSGSSSRSSSSSSGSKSFSSGSGKSYSSGSSSSGDRRGYSSGKSYSSSGSKYSSGSSSRNDTSVSKSSKSSGSSSGFNYDTAAARARKEETSKSDFTKYKDSQSPPRVRDDSYRGGAPPVTTPSSRSYRRTVYVPDTVVIQTRPTRVWSVFNPYWYRPVVVYHDPYSSFFWWWLLDRSIEDQAWWAYHHRYDMDPSRYQALLANNQQLESRVAQLEAQQTVQRDPTYTPTNLDRDLMYSDQYVNQSYNNRATDGGRIAFWVLAVPAAIASCWFFIWLIWFKRWQTA